MNHETVESGLPLTEDRIAMRQKRQAIRRARERKRRRRLIRSCIVLLLAIVLFISIIYGLSRLFSKSGKKSKETTTEITASVEEVAPEIVEEFFEPLSPKATSSTKTLGDTIDSDYAVLIDAETGNIIAQKNADAVIPPASMTKIMTVLVAAENIDDWNAQAVMNQEIGAICFSNGCSVVGYEIDEPMPVEDLMYGTILPSGADAALALAIEAAGSIDDFVDLMNKKVDELGLSSTCHFTNCIGLYDENLHCTVKDMAIILDAALDNERCQQALSTKIYTTAPNTIHQEGLVISNWFLRRIEDKDTGNINVISAKTGYVYEAGSCCASYAELPDGHGFYCVTGNADSSWDCIYDHVALYKEYCSTAD